MPWKQLHQTLSEFVRRHAVWLLWVLAWPACHHVFELGRVLVVRNRYPGNIEWMEGGALYHAYRLIHGQALYTPPGEGFMPYPYPPLHPALLAVLGKVFGLTYSTGRALSLAAVLLFAVLVSIEVYRQFVVVVSPEDRWRGSLLAIPWVLLLWGVFAVGYPLTDGWYDIIRGDSLAMGMVGAAAFLVSRLSESESGWTSWSRASWFQLPNRRELGMMSLTALVLGAALFTKQTNVFPAVWLLLFLLFRSPRRALWVGGLTGIGCLLTLAILEYTTDGNFLFYIVKMLAEHGIIDHRLAKGRKLILEFAWYLPWLGVAVAALALHGALSARSALWFGLLVSLVPASLLPYAKGGGYVNNFVPLVLACGPALFFVLGDIIRIVGSRRAQGVALLVCAAGISFYVWHKPDKYGPRPSAAQFRAMAELKSYLKGLGPNFVAVSDPFLAVEAGSQLEQIHDMPWRDAAGAKVPGLDPSRIVTRQKPDFVLVGNDDAATVRCGIDRYYVRGRGPHPPATRIALRGKRRFTQLRVPRAARQREEVLFDFEDGLEGWSATGNAFRNGVSPSEGVPNQRFVACGQGRYLANSYDPNLRDAARGELRSPPLKLKRNHMALLVGSGGTTRVELWVAGKPVRTAQGKHPQILYEIVWDVRKYRNRTAELRIIDDDSQGRGHILVDEIKVFD